MLVNYHNLNLLSYSLRHTVTQWIVVSNLVYQCSWQTPLGYFVTW